MKTDISNDFIEPLDHKPIISPEIIDEQIEEFNIKSPNTLIIKGKFKFKNANVCGIFTILLLKGNNTEYYEDNSDILSNNNAFIKSHMIASYFSDLFLTDISESWITLEEKFNTLEIKSDYAVSITDTFKKVFYDAFIDNNERVTSLIKDFNTNKINNIHKELTNILSLPYKDRSVQVELSFEELNSEDIESIKNFRIIEEKPEANNNILTTPSVVISHQDYYIPANPILAPTGEGISINQLFHGTRILMRVDSNTDYGKQWIENFHLLNPEKNTIDPIVGTVDQIGPIIKNKVDIIVKYKKNQYTKFNIEAGVKLKQYNPKISESTVDPLKIYNEQQDSNNSTNYSQIFDEPGLKPLIIVGILLTVLSLVALYFI